MDINIVAEYLGVTPRQIDRYAADDGLPIHRLGAGPKARKRYYLHEIDTWLRNRCSDDRRAS